MATATETSNGGHEENVGEFIVDHVKNSGEWHIPGLHIHLPTFEPINIFGISIDMSITNHVVMLWIAAIFLILLFRFSFKRDKMVQTGVASLLEMLIIFLRDEIAINNLGKKDGVKFTHVDKYSIIDLNVNRVGASPIIMYFRKIN